MARLTPQTAIAVQACLQLAHDKCTELFNDAYIRTMDRKADILNTYEVFKGIDKGIRRTLGNDTAELQNLLCDMADAMEPHMTALNNAFLTETVRKFDFAQAKPLAGLLTATAVVRCADDLFTIHSGSRSRRIADLAACLESFGNHFRVRALNPGDISISTAAAKDASKNFTAKLLELAGSVITR